MKSSGIPLSHSYPRLLQDIKTKIKTAQVRAAFAANEELIHLYWDIGCTILARQEGEGWGSGVIPRLAKDIQNELPDVKGFSERNIGRMLAFYRAYSGGLKSILPQAASKLPQAAAKSSEWETLPPVFKRLPWFHHILLMEKIKDLPTRLWYMYQILEHGWSRSILIHQIESRVHERAGKAVHNFEKILPPVQSDLAVQTLKDPYVFDFLTLAEPFHEREMETQLIRHLEKFLLELGQGFAFVGRQYRLTVGQEDFYLDLLFYHLKLRAFVVIELKKGPFKAEYAGKMNFYCNVVDDHLRQPADQPTIGLILCQDKNRLVAEYALKGMKKAIGVSEYKLTRALPQEFKSSLPSIAEIEKELMRLTSQKVSHQK